MGPTGSDDYVKSSEELDFGEYFTDGGPLGVLKRKMIK